MREGETRFVKRVIPLSRSPLSPKLLWALPAKLRKLVWSLPWKEKERVWWGKNMEESVIAYICIQKNRKPSFQHGLPRGCLLFLREVFIQLMNQLVHVCAMRRASILQGFCRRAGAAQAMHSKLHEDTCRSAILAQHFAQRHRLFDLHHFHLTFHQFAVPAYVKPTKLSSFLVGEGLRGRGLL